MTDDDEARPPLPPEDRLWRHPSELARPAAVGRGRRNLAAVGVVSGLAGAAAAVLALAALGAFTTAAPGEPDLAAVPSSPPSSAPPTTAATARAVASSVAPAVVGVTAEAGDVVRQGSGVVARSDGLVLTSAQLVAGATGGAVTVVWPSGRAQEAVVEGIDPLTGLAALTVAGRGFPTATLDMSPPHRGEQAITVSARTEGVATVVDGRVSATSTHVANEGAVLVGLIETDTPIPADADGGALVDADGNLRGVCLALADGSGGGWAVPAEVALRVADDLRRLGRVDRGWLGVSGGPAAVDGAVPAGFSVDAVALGSPAEAVGLQVGDVLLAVDDHRVRSLDDIKAALTLTRPGQTVAVELNRADQTLELPVTLAATPA